MDSNIAKQAVVSGVDMKIDSEKMAQELEQNDYIREHNKRKEHIKKRKNTVRNITCPICSSGKKFKKCCW